MISTDGDAGRVNLRLAGIRERGTFLERSERGSDVTSLCVGGEVKHIAITASRKHHGIRCVRSNFAGYQVSSNDAARLAIHDYDVQHLGHRKHLAAA